MTSWHHVQLAPRDFCLLFARFCSPRFWHRPSACFLGLFCLPQSRLLPKWLRGVPTRLLWAALRGGERRVFRLGLKQQLEKSPLRPVCRRCSCLESYPSKTHLIKICSAASSDDSITPTMAQKIVISGTTKRILIFSVAVIMFAMTAAGDRFQCFFL